MTAPSQPEEGCCGRCTKAGPVFAAEPAWGRVKSPLCGGCWGKYAAARDADTYVDHNDAFDNASDAEYESALFGGNST